MADDRLANWPLDDTCLRRFLPACLPMPLILHGLRQAQKQGPIVIYLHPWELDPDTPRLPLSRRDAFITYHNTGASMRRRLETLLDNFDFAPMWDVLGEQQLHDTASVASKPENQETRERVS